MKAVIINRHGGPEVLTITDIEKPSITRPDQVLVKLNAAGINPVDTKFRQGNYPLNNFPVILGCDGAGTIEAVGDSVTGFKPGDDVYFFHGGFGIEPGNYAEYTVVKERFLAHKPENINHLEAAALPLVLITAWESMHDRARIQSGQRVLIHAGAGGVGLVAIQLAKLAGAKVCATVSNDKKASLVKKYGVDFTINYNQDNFVEAVLDWTHGEGVDIAMDNVGGNLLQATFPAVKHYGDLVTLLLPDTGIDWTVARQRNLRFSMEIMLTPQLLGLELEQRRQTRILNEGRQLVEQGKLSIYLSATYPLEDVVKAHQSIESGSTMGKIVLKIN